MKEYKKQNQITMTNQFRISQHQEICKTLMLYSFLLKYKQNEDSCKMYLKQKHIQDFLQEICSNEVVSQKVLIKKKEVEYEDYYDQIRENDSDQFKFQTILIMKLVDSHQSSKQNK